MIELLKEIIAMSKLPIKTITWVYLFSAILLLCVLLFPAWPLSQFISKYLVYIILFLIGSLLLLIIDFVIYFRKKCKRKNKLTTIISNWQNFKPTIKNIKVLNIQKEVPTDTNSSDFLLGNKGIVHDITIYNIDPSQRIVKKFDTLLTETITIIEDLHSSFPAIYNYLDQIKNISIDRDFENKNDVDIYLKDQTDLIINYSNSLKKMINERS